jgi:hypothetical protein
MGTVTLPASAEVKAHEFYAEQDGVQVISGFSQVYSYLLERTQTQKTGLLALRDYYPYWAAEAESDRAGKLLLLDRADQSVQQVFFDDNIERDRLHILDPRDVRSGEHITLEQGQDIYFVKAEPLLAIRNERYFIDKLNTCLSNQNSISTGI